MSIYYAVLYKYPSLEGSHVTYVLSGGTHFQWGWVPHAMAPLPPVFHQGDLVHGSGPFLAGNPDLRHLWLNRSNYRHGKSLSTTRSLWKPMKRIKKNTTTTLRLATKIKHRSQSQVVSQFSPVNHRAGKNCETLHLHDQSPLTLHLEGFSGFFFFSGSLLDKPPKGIPSSGSHMQHLRKLRCHLSPPCQRSWDDELSEAFRSWPECAAAKNFRNQHIHFRMCKYVNTNLPILLDATLHKLTDCKYPLNPRKSECDSPGFPHCLSNIYPEVENEEANLRTTFGST